MASSSGNSSVSTKINSSGSEEDLRILMEQRKKKRKQSNCESARRSRMRKQKHLDDLMAQVAQLREDNGKILANINLTFQHYLNVEAENAILRVQMAELSQRLQSLDDMINLVNTNAGVYETDHSYLTNADNFMNPMNMNMLYLNQPIMASADIFQW